MVYKHNKLEGLMKECGYTQKMMAEQLGISSVSLRNKLNNRTDFTRREIDIIRSLLNIGDLTPYFFAK